MAATANALAHVGGTRYDGAALDEIDVLGLSGGIGFMYALFEWKGEAPTLTLTTRTDSMPDVTVAEALGRSGVAHEVFETTGAATARRHLLVALEGRHPGLVSVDESQLAHRPSGGDPQGGLPRIVGVIGQREDVVLLDDEDPEPIEVSLDELAAARSAVPRSRHRLVVLGRTHPEHDHRRALADLTAPGAGRGLWATFVDRAADALDRPALSDVAAAAAWRARTRAGGLTASADPAVGLQQP